MATNFRQCYVKHFHKSKNLSGMTILVQNVRTISQEWSFLNQLVSFVSIEAPTVNNIFRTKYSPQFVVVFFLRDQFSLDLLFKTQVTENVAVILSLFEINLIFFKNGFPNAFLYFTFSPETDIFDHCTKNEVFSLRISSVNVTKSAEILLKKSLMENFIFCSADILTVWGQSFNISTTVAAALKQVKAMVISMTTIFYFHEKVG